MYGIIPPNLQIPHTSKPLFAVYVWMGVEANKDELIVAQNIAQILAADYNGSGDRQLVDVEEGSEPAEFWAALGGKCVPG